MVKKQQHSPCRWIKEYIFALKNFIKKQDTWMGYAVLASQGGKISNYAVSFLYLYNILGNRSMTKAEHVHRVKKEMIIHIVYTIAHTGGFV